MEGLPPVQLDTPLPPSFEELERAAAKVIPELVSTSLGDKETATNSSETNKGLAEAVPNTDLATEVLGGRRSRRKVVKPDRYGQNIYNYYIGNEEMTSSGNAVDRKLGTEQIDSSRSCSLSDWHEKTSLNGIRSGWNTGRVV